MQSLTARGGVPTWLRAAVGLAGRAPGGRARIGADEGLLPDFCAGPVVLNVVVIAEMFAFMAALVTRRISVNVLQDLLLISLFVQWVALASVAVLCWARHYLNRLPRPRAVGMA